MTTQTHTFTRVHTLANTHSHKHTDTHAQARKYMRTQTLHTQLHQRSHANPHKHTDARGRERAYIDAVCVVFIEEQADECVRLSAPLLGAHRKLRPKTSCILEFVPALVHVCLG